MAVIQIRDEATWLQERKRLLTASDIAVVMGHSHFKTLEELWLEKTGIQDAKDISDRPQVQRGKEREPEIRKHFAEEHPELTVTYHPYDIYVSDEQGYGMLGATLDAECVVNKDTGRFVKSMRGHAEFKSVGYRCDKDLEAWMQAPPSYYVDQVLQQMFCYNDYFAYLMAEFTMIDDDGKPVEGQERFYREYFFCLSDWKEQMMNVVNRGKEFMEKNVATKTPPATVLEGGKEGEKEVAVIQADVEIGRFYENFEQVKHSVELMVEPYKNAVFTEETVKDAQAIHAKLNSMYKDIDDKRKVVKKKYEEPLKAFEAKAKELTSIIEAVRVPIKEQLDSFEARRQDEKRQAVMNRATEIMAVLFNDDEQLRYYQDMGGIIFDSKWLNKTVKMADIDKVIEDQIVTFLSEYKAIAEFCKDDPEMQSMMFSEYARTRSLSDAMQTRDRVMSAREQARKLKEQVEARKKAEAERQAQIDAMRAEARRKAEAESENAVVIDTKVETQDNIPTSEEKKDICYSFEVHHESIMAFRDLFVYMKEHGFRFQKLN